MVFLKTFGMFTTHMIMMQKLFYSTHQPKKPSVACRVADCSGVSIPPAAQPASYAHNQPEMSQNCIDQKYATMKKVQAIIQMVGLPIRKYPISQYDSHLQAQVSLDLIRNADVTHWRLNDKIIKNNVNGRPRYIKQSGKVTS